MSSTHNIVLTVADDLEATVDLDPGDSRTALKNLINYLQAMLGGRKSGTLGIRTGLAYATATLTVSSTGSVNDETMTIAGITFTAKTSGATGNQFNISSTPATQATNMANAFNASSDLAGIVTAEAAGAVVALTSVVPGLVGNGLEITESLTNVALSNWQTEDTGSQVASYSLDVS